MMYIIAKNKKHLSNEFLDLEDIHILAHITTFCFYSDVTVLNYQD